MMQFDSVEQILDFAISKEEEAAQLYTDLAAKVKTPGMKEVFAGFAKEEQGHKTKLVQVKEGKQLLPAEQQIIDLKIGEYLVDIEIKADMDYQEALILAMKAEKAAYRLYNNLAQAAPNESVRALFLSLAQEEAKHKLRFEVEYDENILKEN
jgi:rubrerythrin